MRNDNIHHRSGSNMGWIAGAVVVLLLLGGLVMFWSPGSVNTASNNMGASSPSSTTGSASAPARPAAPAR